MDGDVVSLASYRKTLEGRKPLYVTHGTGRIQGKRVDPRFEERIGNIRERLARINRLMDEIRLNSQLEEKLRDDW